MKRRLRSISPGLVALGLTACVDPGVHESSTGDDGSGGITSRGSDSRGSDGDDDPTGSDESGNDEGDSQDSTDTSNDSGTGDMAVPTGADILFVIDNSWSMGEEQGLLAAAMEQLSERLLASRREIDFRLALTSTDNGHKACNSRPGKGGPFQLKSCLDREDNFTDPAVSISRFNTACQSHCKYTEEDLGRRATTTDLDPEAEIRPWVEVVAGRSNLAEDIPLAGALACYAPLGIDGCGYEAQLESMYRAIGLSLESNQPSYDFVRPGALLHIVHVTDEAECSYNHKARESSSIFDVDNSTFWANPEVGPTSSICWNAGVSCSGENSGYYERCEATNKDLSGQPITDTETDQAMLFPLERYRQFFDAVDEQKARLGLSEGVTMSLIAGVDGTGQALYPTGQGTEHFNQFGIGAGCVGTVDVEEEKIPGTNEKQPAHRDDSYAVPPVRLMEFIEGYGNADWPRAHSICNSSFKDALADIATQISSRFEPACVQYCAADSAVESPSVEGTCRVTARYRDVGVDVPECRTRAVVHNGLAQREYLLDERGRLHVPDDSDVCFTIHGDAGGHTPSPLDDLARGCQATGYNLSAMIHHRWGRPATAGTTYAIDCAPSQNPAVDCPDLL